MSGALIIGLIVVVWLFVLAPLVLRGYRPIRRTNDAFEETRVVIAGGDTPAPMRKRPRFSAADARHRDGFHTGVADLSGEQAHDIQEETVEQRRDEQLDEQLADAPQQGFVAEKLTEVFTAAQEKVAENDQASTVVAAVQHTGVDVQHSDVVDERYLFMEDIDSPPTTGSFALPVVDDSAPYPYDDAYACPADFLDPDADYEFVDDVAVDEPDLVAELSEDFAGEDLTEEDLEFAARRRGRGGYDPEIDAAVAMSRYQRRQRTLATLGGLSLISVVLGVIFGGWFWIGVCMVAAVAALYLYALRRQVRAENALRLQRIRHMRRARLGVRNAVDEKLGIPQRLRRPGAIVIEVDDESPDFVTLDTVYSNVGYDESEVWEDEYVDSRQAG